MFQRISTRLITIALLIWFVLGLLVGFLDVALDPVVYDRIQQEIDVYDSVGMNREALSRVNELLVDYLKDETDSLTTKEEIFGIRQQVFNEQEILHMVDVKNLFQVVQILQKIISVVSICFFWVILNKLFEASIKPFILPLLKAFRNFFISLVCIFLAGALIFWGIGFERLFIGFHHLFFTNDLWLMNPLTDVMIRMFPSEFFERIVGEIILNMTWQSIITPFAIVGIIFVFYFIILFFKKAIPCFNNPSDKKDV